MKTYQTQGTCSRAIDYEVTEGVITACRFVGGCPGNTQVAREGQTSVKLGILSAMTKRAYLFDMDGVLVDNCRYHVQAWLEFARRHGGHLTKAQVVAWMGAPGRDYLARMFDAPLDETRATALLREKEALYREIFRPHLVAREGLVDFLSAARADGIPCAVSTGGTMDNVDYVLDGLGLRAFFAAVVDSSQYVRGKPAPECYLAAAEKLGVAPSACCVFEDALNGIAAAQGAGMDVVAITGTNPRAVLESAHPTRIIDSFRELLV